MFYFFKIKNIYCRQYNATHDLKVSVVNLTRLQLNIKNNSLDKSQNL